MKVFRVEQAATPQVTMPLTWQKVRWETLIPYVSMYLLCLGAFFVRVDGEILTVFVVSYFFRAVPFVS